MELKDCVYDGLKNLEIDTLVIKHKAMYSEKDTNFEDFADNIVIGKNLFLRNKNKSKYYLVMLPLTKKVDLIELANKLNETRFSFANENELYEHLKITPGSVSYLNIITAEKLGGNFKEITYIIDKELLSAEKIGFHPSDNTETTVTIPESIIKVLDAYKLNYNILEL